jgi:phosphotriesterase-related protein
MPSDAQRMDFIEQLIADGYGDKVVVAHDICTKDRTAKFGGHGLDHILTMVVPRMRRRGWKDEDIDAILIGNPARALTYA